MKEQFGTSVTAWADSKAVVWYMAGCLKAFCREPCNKSNRLFHNQNHSERRYSPEDGFRSALPVSPKYIALIHTNKAMFTSEEERPRYVQRWHPRLLTLILNALAVICRPPPVFLRTAADNAGRQADQRGGGDVCSPLCGAPPLRV